MSELEIEGICDEHGRIKLSRKPRGMKVPSRVLVKFLDTDDSQGIDAARQAAIELVMADLSEGLHLGGSPYPKREDLYDRDER